MVNLNLASFREMQRLFCLATLIYLMKCLHHLPTEEKLLHEAVDKEAVVGERVVIECSTKPGHTAEWIHTPVDADSFFIVYKQGLIFDGYLGRMCVNEDTGNGVYNLTILKVDLEDAGSYSCLDTSGDQRKVELTVFYIRPSNETCSFSIPRDTVDGFMTCRPEPLSFSLSCNMSYRGNTDPIMEWRNNTSNTVVPSTTTRNSDNTTTSQVDIKAFPNLQYSYSVQIKYRTIDLKSSYGWSSPQFTVSPFHMVTEKITSPEEINCSSYINISPCNCTWKDDTEKYISHGPSLVLNSLSDGTYTCTAECQLRRHDSCTFKAAQVTFSKSGHYVTVGIVVAFITVVVIIIIFITIRCVRFRSRQHQERWRQNQNCGETDQLQ